MAEEIRPLSRRRCRVNTLRQPASAEREHDVLRLAKPRPDPLEERHLPGLRRDEVAAEESTATYLVVLTKYPGKLTADAWETHE
jgi:hypothetical protein